jgi:phage FluMu gp28-like protein
LRFINDPSRKRIVEKARQVGISLTAPYDLVRKPSPARSSCNTWVSFNVLNPADPFIPALRFGDGFIDKH